MTNLEVIQHLINDSAQVPESRLIIAAQMLGLQPQSEYIDADQKLKCKVYRIAISEIMRSVEKVKRESEGGYTKEYIDSTGATLKLLANDSGCDELLDLISDEPIIKSVSHLW